MVRQDNVKEESRVNEQRSPSKRTFAEAKQTLPDYDDMNQMNTYNETMYSNENAFLEADEDDSYELNAQLQIQQQQQQLQQQYQTNYYGDVEEVEELAMHHVVGAPNVHSVESYLNDSLPEYSPPADENTWYGARKPHRRSSREFHETEMVGPSQDDGHRRKPEAMRSISEDTPTRTAKQAVTRRTLSHPEKESLSQVGVVGIIPTHLSYKIKCISFHFSPLLAKFRFFFFKFLLSRPFEMEIR